MVENSLSLKIFLNPVVRNSTSNPRGILFGVKMKKCTKCKLEKELTDFRKDRQKKDGLRNDCKECCKKHYQKNKTFVVERIIVSKKQDPDYLKKYKKENKEKIKIRDREYQLKNKDKISEYQKEYRYKQKLKTHKECKVCFNLTDRVNFRKDNKSKDGIKSTCKICDKAARDLKKPIKKTKPKKSQEEIIEARRNYYQANKEKLNKYAKEYKIKNSEEIKKTRNKYQKKRLSEDFVYSFKFKINSSIRKSFKKRNCIKSKRTEEILGCTITEFIDYISSKFTEGMTLENHGKWHFDHIIPISSAKTEEDVIRLNHYTNLQPLWAEDNMKKGSKIL